MTNEITINSADLDLMEAYEAGRRNGNGEAAGYDSDSPSEAAEREGWTILRTIHEGTNCPGTPVFAQDAAGCGSSMTSTGLGLFR